MQQNLIYPKISFNFFKQNLMSFFWGGVWTCSWQVLWRTNLVLLIRTDMLTTTWGWGGRQASRANYYKSFQNHSIFISYWQRNYLSKKNLDITDIIQFYMLLTHSSFFSMVVFNRHSHLVTFFTIFDNI